MILSGNLAHVVWALSFKLEYHFRRMSHNAIARFICFFLLKKVYRNVGQADKMNESGQQSSVSSGAITSLLIPWTEARPRHPLLSSFTGLYHVK